MKPFIMKCSSLLCLAALIVWAGASSLAYAENEFQAEAIRTERAGEDFKISGQLAGSSTYAALVVLFPGKQLNIQYDVPVDATGTVSAAEIVPVTDGYYEYLHPVGEDGPYGVYTIHLRYEDSIYEAAYRFTKGGASYTEELKEEINSGADILETLLEYNDLVLLDEEWFTSADKALTAYFQEMLSGCIPITDIDAFLAETDRAAQLVQALDKANSAGSPEEFTAVLKENAEILGIGFDTDDAEAKAFLSEVFQNRPFFSVEPYQALNEKYVLAKLNAASWGGYAEIIKLYDTIGIDIDAELENFTAKQRERLFSELAERSPFENLVQFREAFSDAKKEALSQNQSSGGSVQSGGSSGGRGGSQIASSAVTLPPEPEPEKLTFSDLDETEWARESIEYLASISVVSGVGENRFHPAGNVKREEFLKMVLNALGYTVKSGKCPFTDIASDAWYENYVYTAYTEEIVTGKTETLFGTGEAITRQDAAVILSRALEKRGIFLDVTGSGTAPADADKIADYAAGAVETMFRAGVLTGDENAAFLPQENLTRAQAAKMLYGILMNTTQEEAA